MASVNGRAHAGVPNGNASKTPVGMSDAELSGALAVAVIAGIAVVAISPQAGSAFGTSGSGLVIFGVALTVVCLALAYADLRGEPAPKAEAGDSGHIAAGSQGEAHTVKAKQEAGAEPAEGAPFPRRTALTLTQDEFTPDDPLWSADWTSVTASGTVESGPSPPMEVFELNDTPTWIARLEQRREQADRAGKHKVAQRLTKQIAEARLAQMRAMSNKQAAPQMSREMSGRSGPTTEENDADAIEGDGDVWDLDWSRVQSDQPAQQSSPPPPKAEVDDAALGAADIPPVEAENPAC